MTVYVDFNVPADLADSTVGALEVARNTGIVRKGTNETTKSIERGNAQLVLIAEDVSPEEIVMYLSELADEKGISSIFVETQDNIGHAADLKVGSVTAAIVDASDASDDVEDIAIEVENLRQPTMGVDEQASDSTPAEVIEVVGKIGAHGETMQVKCRIRKDSNQDRIITRNVPGPVREGDILQLRETQRDTGSIGRQ